MRLRNFFNLTTSQKSAPAGVKGFTLIQISILLTVAALVLVTLLPSTQTVLTANTATTTKMNTILAALRQFQAEYGRLPCPADASLPISGTNYGVEAQNPGTSTNCSGGNPAANYTDTTNKVAIGMVPVRALALSNDYALDAYGRDITYAVDTNATTLGWSSISLTGQIVVADNGANNNTVVALISHGADGHGAWLPLPGTSGTASRLNAGSGDHDQHYVNAHAINPSGFPANYSTLNTLVANSESTTSTFVNKVPTNTYDDLVVYKSLLWNINNIPAAVPQITSVSPPANGAYTLGNILTFTVTYNMAVTVNTFSGTHIPRLDLTFASGTRYATYQGTSGTNGNILTFSYTIAAGDSSPTGISVAPVDTNGGTIMNGNAYADNGFTLVPLTSVTVNTATYTYARSITVNHTLVGTVNNTDQVNFPLLFAGTYAYLATVANGGNVTNANGYDISFTSDSLCATRLPFEQDSYNAVNGAVAYWIKIPTLSHSTNTVIYLCYNNPVVVSDQSNKTAVWDSNYLAVYHLPNGTTLTANDSTANGNNATISGATAATGTIGGAGNFNGANSYIRVPSSTYTVSTTGNVSFSAWVKTSTHGIIIGNTSAPPGTVAWSTLANYVPMLYIDSSGYVRATIAWPGYNYPSAAISPGTYNDNNWHYVVHTFLNGNSGGQENNCCFGGTSALYIDGALVSSASIGNYAATSEWGFYIGTGCDWQWVNSSGACGYYGPETNGGWDYFNGLIDEVEISQTARSSDWIITQYNNQSAPGTFYTMGSVFTP